MSTFISQLHKYRFKLRRARDINIKILQAKLKHLLLNASKFFEFVIFQSKLFDITFNVMIINLWKSDRSP